MRETHIYPKDTTDGNGALKTEYVEIGTEVTERLERIPAKAFIDRTVRHKVISKAELGHKNPEERKILIASLPLSPIDKEAGAMSICHQCALLNIARSTLYYITIKIFK